MAILPWDCQKRKQIRYRNTPFSNLSYLYCMLKEISSGRLHPVRSERFECVVYVVKTVEAKLTAERVGASCQVS